LGQRQAEVESKLYYVCLPRLEKSVPMRSIFARLTALALACAAGLTGPVLAAESTARGLGLSNYHVYAIKMDTTVKAPLSGRRCTNVRVWHALPTHRPWSQAANPYGTLDQIAQPTSAIVEAEKDNRSCHFFWSATHGQLPGVETHYISNFRVVSPDRHFDTSYCRASWPDVLRYNAENHIRFASPVTEISQVASGLKENHTPIETVIECSKWIKENLVYDASVTWAGDDLSSILTYRRGHCGHNMTVMIALLGAVGIQCRSVMGLNLRYPTGSIDYDQSRNDFTNGHIWGEVFLPDVGWIEIEPSGGEKCFNVPSSYIQNNTSFQNYAVWITEQGQAPRVPRWTLVGKKYVNDYGLDNKITYDESRR